MSDFKADLKNVQSSGEEIYKDYQGGQGLNKDDLQKGEDAGKKVFADYKEEAASEKGAGVADNIKNLLKN